VFYHLGELDSALTYALGAGSLFDVNDTSDYVQTLVGGSLIGGSAAALSRWAAPRLHHLGYQSVRAPWPGPCQRGSRQRSVLHPSDATLRKLARASQLLRGPAPHLTCLLRLAARALDQYFKQRVRAVDHKEEVEVDERLVSVVERMITRWGAALARPPTAAPLHAGRAHQTTNARPRAHMRRCCADAQYEQAVGIAMEARRLDKQEQVISGAPDVVAVLKWVPGRRWPWRRCAAARLQVLPGPARWWLARALVLGRCPPALPGGSQRRRAGTRCARAGRHPVPAPPGSS
jgi:hypothetical protein